MCFEMLGPTVFFSCRGVVYHVRLVLSGTGLTHGYQQLLKAAGMQHSDVKTLCHKKHCIHDVSVTPSESSQFVHYTQNLHDDNSVGEQVMYTKGVQGCLAGLRARVVDKRNRSFYWFVRLPQQNHNVGNQPGTKTSLISSRTGIRCKPYTQK